MNISTINKTEFENDPFTEVDKATLDTNYPDEIGIYIISLIKLTVCIAALSADFFLLIVMCRFRKIRQVRINKYILNLVILNIIYYLGVPLYFIIEHLVFEHHPPSMFLFQTQSTVLILYITFAIGLALDWFVSSYKPLAMTHYKVLYPYVFGGIYVVFFIEWIFAFIYSENHHIVRMSILSVFYVAFFVVLIIVNILKYKLSLKTDSTKIAHALTTANIIYLAYCPIFIYYLLLSLFSSEFVHSFLLFTEFVPNLIELGHPIVVVYMLGRTNKYFKMAYSKSFKRSVREYEAENDLDDVSEDGQIESRSDGLQVALNRDQRNGNKDDVVVIS